MLKFVISTLSTGNKNLYLTYVTKSNKVGDYVWADVNSLRKSKENNTAEHPFIFSTKEQADHFLKNYIIREYPNTACAVSPIVIL